MDVGRQCFLNLLHLGFYSTCDGHGVGAGLFGDDKSCAVLTVDFLVEGEVFYGVADGGKVAHKHLFACGRKGYGDVSDFGAFDVFTLDTHLVLLLAHFDGARGKVEVVGADGRAHLFEAEAVGVELFGVEVDINIAFGGTADGDIADAVDTIEFVNHIVLQNAVEARVALLGSETVYHDRHGAGVEFQNHGARDTIGEVVVEQVDE